METLRKLKWDVLYHPPYSPDLAQSDFHLFGNLKEFLGGKKFQSTDEVINVNNAAKGVLLFWNYETSRSLEQMIAVAGDYIEK